MKYYKIKKGDSLSKIRKELGLDFLSFKSIQTLNPKIKDINVIQPGWVLRLPSTYAELKATLKLGKAKKELRIESPPSSSVGLLSKLQTGKAFRFSSIPFAPEKVKAIKFKAMERSRGKLRKELKRNMELAKQVRTDLIATEAIYNMLTIPGQEMETLRLYSSSTYRKVREILDSLPPRAQIKTAKQSLRKTAIQNQHKLNLLDTRQWERLPLDSWLLTAENQLKLIKPAYQLIMRVDKKARVLLKGVLAKIEEMRSEEK